MKKKAKRKNEEKKHLHRLRRHIELLTRTAAAVRCDVGGGPQAARCSRSRCSGARAAGAARAGAAAAAAAAAVAHEISYSRHIFVFWVH